MLRHVSIRTHIYGRATLIATHLRERLAAPLRAEPAARAPARAVALGRAEPVAAASDRASVYGTCVVMGPGDIAQAHMADEWIELEQLAKMRGILEKWFQL